MRLKFTDPKGQEQIIDLVALMGASGNALEIDTNGSLHTTQVSAAGTAQGFVGGAAKVVATNLEPINEVYADGLFSVATTAAAMLTTTDLSPYRGMVLTYANTGAETLAITGYYDSAATKSGGLVWPIDASTGAIVSNAAALPAGTYYFNNIYRKMKFTKSAAVETGTITGAAMAQTL